MKFAIMTHITSPESKGPRRRLEEPIEDVPYAEEGGSSSAWYAAQHCCHRGRSHPRWLVNENSRQNPFSTKSSAVGPPEGRA
jgi:hypothetical protein